MASQANMCDIAHVCLQDEFELDDSDKTVIAPNAPRHWRLRHQQLDIGAFEGLHVSMTNLSVHIDISAIY